MTSHEVVVNRWFLALAIAASIGYVGALLGGSLSHGVAAYWVSFAILLPLTALSVRVASKEKP